MRLPKGFTLIELLIVVSVIAVLVGVGVVTYGNVQKSARDSRRAEDLKAIETALAQYAANNDGKYPSTCPAGETTCVGTSQIWTGESTCNGSGAFQLKTQDTWIPSLVTGGYIKQLPRDPRTGKDNSATHGTGSCAGNLTCYIYQSDGVDYKASATCTPEHPVQPTESFFDPGNGGRTFTMVRYSSGGRNF